MSLRVLLVDDVPELRSVLEQALRSRGGFQIVAEAGDGHAAVVQADAHEPDIIVLSLGLPDLVGRELLTRLREVSPSSLVVVHSGSHSNDGATIAQSVDAFVDTSGDVGYLVELIADVGTRVPRRARLRVGPDLGDVAGARRFVHARLREWGCAAATEDASIVVSELVANALVHVRAWCDLSVGLRGNVLRIEVVDHGSAVPDLQEATVDDEHGRGLVLVSLLCRAWGTEPHADGKRVWAELQVQRSGGPGARTRTSRVDARASGWVGDLCTLATV